MVKIFFKKEISILFLNGDIIGQLYTVLLRECVKSLSQSGVMHILMVLAIAT